LAKQYIESVSYKGLNIEYIHDKIYNLVDSNKIKQPYNKFEKKHFEKSGISEKFKKILPKYKIEWIPFHRLSNIEIIGKGGFSTVYRAILLDSKHDKQHDDYESGDYSDVDYESVGFNDVNYDNIHESSNIVTLKTIDKLKY
ncbi:5422_t:CDS:2, partial [Racocetra fulgida]